MYANIQRYATAGERVLVVAGQGHTAMLRDFLQIDGDESPLTIFARFCSSDLRDLENKIPPPLVAVAFGAAMWSVSNYVPGIELREALRIGVAVLVALIGGFFCIASVVSFRRAKTTVNPLKPEAASALVTSGIYQVSRNPIYVGLALFLVAWAVYLSSPFALVGVMGFVLYINRFQIQPEERALAVLFAAEFERYKNSVRRWV